MTKPICEPEQTPWGFCWGPLIVERTASGPKIGYVVTVRMEDGERVEVRTSPGGGSGLQVKHVLWDSIRPTDTKEPQGATMSRMEPVVWVQWINGAAHWEPARPEDPNPVPLYTADQIRAMVGEVRGEANRRVCGWTITQNEYRGAADALDAILARLP